MSSPSCHTSPTIAVDPSPTSILPQMFQAKPDLPIGAGRFGLHGPEQWGVRPTRYSQIVRLPNACFSPVTGPSADLTRPATAHSPDEKSPAPDHRCRTQTLSRDPPPLPPT